MSDPVSGTTVQEEVCTVIEQSGLTLNKAQHDQLYKAIMQLITNQIPAALLKKNNLSDLIDKALARANLELKSAAIRDVTASNFDTTPGRLMQVGDFGIGGTTISIPNGSDVHAYFIGKPTGKYRAGSEVTGAAYPGQSWHEFDWMNYGANYGFLIEYTTDGRSAKHVLVNGAWIGVYEFLTSAGGSFNSTFKFGRVETLPQEQNPTVLFSRTGPDGTIVSGVELNWYANKVIIGIARNGSDGVQGLSITMNGNNLVSIDPSGNVWAVGNISSHSGVNAMSDVRSERNISSAGIIRAGAGLFDTPVFGFISLIIHSQ
ncbi:hypothetical protein [Citrobacter tructae]|uniref:Phage tail protein n=1 Tax=Citrobacter tructae TaxID=2562449 RepID=A0ABX5T328_9ENTR|nr:hypothetical protein [Citrobacter tructae]QBX79441.1 hypothetical protein E4Z61_03330 [Citrobacter tructae]